MTLTIGSLARHLGRPASDILSEMPFRDWRFEKSVEADLPEPLTDYEFPDRGMDFTSDGADRVRTIFLYFNDQRRFEDLLDIPSSWTRQQVLDHLGPPDRSSDGLRDPILGEYGPWNRFSRADYSIHIEHHVDRPEIKMITLMRADAVP